MSGEETPWKPLSELTFVIIAELFQEPAEACDICLYTVEFTDTTVDPLQQSIEIWTERVNLLDDFCVLTLGPSNCPLCGRFWLKNCAGCPVRTYTGMEGCENSPYDRVGPPMQDLYGIIGSHYESGAYRHTDIKTLPEFQQVWAALRSAFEAELVFLKMLQERQ
jgi:hypothetical protein